MTDFLPSQIQSLTDIIGFGVVAAVVSILWAPLLIRFLYHFRITRRSEYDATLAIESRKDKVNTPVMGGILVILTVAALTLAFNWERRFTWVPIGVMLISALLGGIDDLLNIFGTERRSRSVSQTMTLIRVHRDWKMRLWLMITFPWALFKRASLWLGSHPGKGVHVHEKLLLQFIAGAASAWWIYWKLAENWQELYIPFFGLISIGILIVPLIILVVMFTANAVNISDGMDGLAGGMLIPAFGALAFLSWIAGFNELAILNSVTAGSLISYTYFNIKPARFQMGDVGSLGLGSLLAINALVINQMAILPLIAFMFYAEAVSVLIQVAGRTLLGRRIFRMAPIHHHFELKGWSEEKTIMRFWVVHLGFVLVGVWVGLH
ncbi:MAG: phospho-N-acetylmuramoyl-pentapeptide-transferase [Candidatus Paceibacterota bacterium]|jgi:phospho-N-acetylmuramoyl-pentapeptide-transferase